MSAPVMEWTRSLRAKKYAKECMQMLPSFVDMYVKAFEDLFRLGKTPPFVLVLN